MKESKRASYKDFDVIRFPVVTEKSTILMNEKGTYTFVVFPSATKVDIKRAIESFFEVKVQKVNTLNRKGKTKIFRGRTGRRQDTKRAYVRLEPGYKIDNLGVGV